MRLANDFIIHNKEDEHILLSAGENSFSGIVRLNGIAAFLAEQLQEDITEEGLVDAVLTEYEVERERATEDVRGFVEQLRTIGAIGE